MSENVIIPTILSSAVLSSIITALFSFYAVKKGVFTEHITKERKVWRDELRIIAGKIADCRNVTAFKQQIERLKVRINPYGQTTSKICHDSFIWDFIDRFETERKVPKNKFSLEDKKSELISLISCLLKDDWERSKNEITGNKQNAVLIIGCIISILFLVVYYLPFLNNVCWRFILQYCIAAINITFICIVCTDCFKEREYVFSVVGLFVFLFFIIKVPKYSEVITIIKYFSPFVGFLIYYIVKEKEYRNNKEKLKKIVSKITRHP
jgi:hypothetical protein